MRVIDTVIARASDVPALLRTRWGQLGFRFLVCYLALFAPVVPSSLGFLGLPLHWYESLWRAPVTWVARPFGLGTANASSMTPESNLFELGLVVCFILVAGLATIIWTLRDRSLGADTTIYPWVRTVLRYLLAYGALHYAIVTLFRFELPGLRPEALVTRGAELRARELLWVFFGWSWYFTTFLGVIEAAGAILLLRRQTTLIGALVVGGVLSNVVLLNLAFDVPGKLLSPHFALIAALLILPDLERVWDLHVTGDEVPPVDPRPASGAAWIDQPHGALKTTVVIACLMSPLLLIERSRGYLVRPNAKPLAGLYAVRNRNAATSSTTIGARWRWAIIDDNATRLHVQRLDERWVAYPMSLDTATHRVVLGLGQPSEWRTRVTVADRGPTDTLQYIRATNGRMQLDGSVGGLPTAISLERVDQKIYFTLFTTRRTREMRGPPARPSPKPKASPRAAERSP
jgi:hypothetical protein